MTRASRIVVVAAFIGGAVLGAAQAESCSKSRDYILAGASELPLRPQAYQKLFRTCLATLEMSNVKDAFVLRSGAIAVLPRVDTISATASTLAQFCTRFPKETLHFIGGRDAPKVADISRAVAFGSVNPTSCQKIKGS